MLHNRLRQVITAGLAAIMLSAPLTVMTTPVLMAAPVAQTLEAEAVAGVLTGGEFDKIWLKITPNGNGNVEVTTDWDRNFPEGNGLGFYILNSDGLARVLSGSQDLQEANLSAGSRPSPSSPDNRLGAILQASGGEYTIVLFNDSAADASFTLEVTNATISDDSDQVTDVNATPTAAVDEDAEAEEGDAAESDAADATETPAPVATEEVTATATPAATTAPAEATPAATSTTTSTLPANVTVANGEVRAPELKGELVTQNEQHYFDLIPSERDGEVTITLSFDPQDSSELARRMNFWVLDMAGFNSYADATSDVVLSEIAIAAGSGAPGLMANQRQAKFTASGLGPYVVIVYNNSTVPGTYYLNVDGGMLVDDSAQSMTAQEAQGVGTSTSGSTTTAAADDADADESADAPAATTAPAATSGGREGEPGGTYVVQPGDTLSLIARDIYGDVGLWEELCSFNGLTDCNNIEVGQEINLPTLAEIGSGATAAPAATTAPSGAAAAAAAATATPAATAEVDATEAMTETETMTDTDLVTTTTTTTGTTSTADETEDEAATGVNLVAALEAAGSFSTLVQALEAANLTAALEGAGPFTIFAPTDAAFAGLPSGALDQLLANPTGQLTQILLFHVLPGSVMAADIDNGMQATTQQGKAVTFEVTGDGVRVNGASVIEPDIAASNGVIHGIDAVILPPPD